MSFGPYCKAVGIDEEVLSGEKTLKIDAESLTNGVAWELRKYKVSKKLPMKDAVDWFIKILDLKCENDATLEHDLNEKLEKLSSIRTTFSKAPKSYPGEMDRLMKWRFDIPQSMGLDPVPVFEPMERANLGPKLLKVLKEKGADIDDSMDLSDDDDEQSKRRKAREEIVQLKKDLGLARKGIMGLNERISDLSKRCALLTDVTKISVSENRRIEFDLVKLKAEWNDEIKVWHDCIERLNHASMNKNMYLDVGYMVRRNKTKQGIFDELNFEFDRTLEEFKHKVNSLLNKERQKKKPVSRDYKQKSKSDRKRVRHETDDEKSEDSKKICLSEESAKPEQLPCMPMEEFLKSEAVEEFKGGKFASSLKAIYLDLISMPIPCKNVQEVVFLVLNSLERLNVEKIPLVSFAANIYMEIRMLAMIQAFSDLVKVSKLSISNSEDTKFKLLGTSYEVTLPNETTVVLGVRDLTDGSQDTSVSFLKSIIGQLISTKIEGNTALSQLSQTLKTYTNTYGLLDKKLVDIIFMYKQNIMPKLQSCLDTSPGDVTNKILSLNNFCTGIYFLTGLAELADITVLSWESMYQSTITYKGSILCELAQRINDFCTMVNDAEAGKEFSDFLTKEKKLKDSPLAPCTDNLFNLIFHNSAGIWFYHEIGIFDDFVKSFQEDVEEVVKEEEDTEKETKDVEMKEGDEKAEEEEEEEKEPKEEKKEENEKLKVKVKEESEQIPPALKAFTDKQNLAIARALGLIGKLLAVPMWTVLEDIEDVEIGAKYLSLLRKVELWSKDATKFMRGQERIFDDQQISHDAVYVSLIKENEASDSLTKQILELLFTAFIPYLQSCLYGSGNVESSKMNGDIAVNVKTSIHSDFGMLDRITKSCHSCPTFSFDALMLYSKTRNGEWQDKLGNRNNSKVFEIVQRHSRHQLKSLFKRKIQLNEIKEIQLQDKKDELSKCQLIEKRYKLIDDLIKWGGLWRSEKEVNDRLKDMKEVDRMNALKAQIKFRRHVLGEVQENNLLDLAYDGEVFNSSKLLENLKSVLRKECQLTETDDYELAAATDSMDLKIQIYDSCKNAKEIEGPERQNYAIKENFYWLLGKKLQHSFVRSGMRECFVGNCIARKKMNGVYFYFMRYKDMVFKFSENKIAEDYRSKNLKVIDPSLKDIIGSRLCCAFYKDDGYLEWHDCTVIASAGVSEYIVEFDYYGSDVIYDPYNEQMPSVDAVESLTFKCNILEDYRTGQLRFL